MAFITMNDGITLMDGVIFPDKFKRYETTLSTEQMYIVIGKFEKRNQQNQLIVHQLYEINDYKNKKLSDSKQVVLRNIAELKLEIDQISCDTSKANSIEIKGFNEMSKKITHLGFIEKNNSNFEQLIQSYKPSDIRFI